MRAVFNTGHIDMVPVGDFQKTLLMLVIGNPEIDFSVHFRRGENLFDFETSEIRGHLSGLPLSHPKVIGIIRDRLRKGLDGMGKSVVSFNGDDVEINSSRTG